MTPFNVPVFTATTGAKSTQGRSTAEKSSSPASTEPFKDYLHKAVTKTGRRPESQRAESARAAPRADAGEEGKTTAKETTTDRAAETDPNTKADASPTQRQGSGEPQRTENQDETKSAATTKAGKGTAATTERDGSAGAEEMVKGGRALAAEIAAIHDATAGASPAAAAGNLLSGMAFGPAAGGGAGGVAAGVGVGVGQTPGGSAERLDDLLAEVLGARQGGGATKGGQVENLTLQLATPSTAGSSSSAGFELPEGMVAVTDAANTSGSTATRGETPQLTLSTTRPDFAQEMADSIGRLRTISRPGMPEEVRVILEPKDLGELHVRLQMDKNQQVHVTILAESDAAKELINRDQTQLKNAFAQNDLNFGGLTVNVGGQSHQGTDERWRDGGRQGGGGTRNGEIEGVDPLAARAALSSAQRGNERGLNLFA
ncbi:MAG: flagellar hook-length control protein FliK [Magnetococcales bacterium]|nr:flagellar hook-length control protein FliK [Magnetococcales bacterium]